MEKENSTLAHLIDDSDHSESLPRVLLIAGSAIIILFIICFVMASMTKSPSIQKIEMPEKSALIKPPGEVAGANTQNAEVAGPNEPPKTTPSTSSGSTTPTATPTSAPAANSSPTSTPTPTSKPADPTPSTSHSTLRDELSGSDSKSSGSTTPTPTDTPIPTIEPTTTPTPTT